MDSILNNFFESVKDFSDEELMSKLMGKLEERGITIPCYTTYEKTKEYVIDNIYDEANVPLFTKEVYDRALTQIDFEGKQFTFLDDICGQDEVLTIMNKGEDEDEEESEREEMPEERNNDDDSEY